jgi:hypothetical protein
MKRHLVLVLVALAIASVSADLARSSPPAGL